jgi:DNA sulfur modification protein DndB
MRGNVLRPVLCTPSWQPFCPITKMTAETLVYLSPLLTEVTARTREALKRRKPQDFTTVSREQQKDLEAEGWTFDKELKTKVRLKRGKPFDERLENRFWMFLYKLGYPEQNQGRKFEVLIRRKGAEPLTKQVDVFAKDDETVIVAECKACEKATKNRSLQKDIEEFANLKGPIAQSIQAHYGSGFRPKIIWVFVTENIVWSKPDRERAAGENIRVITERELRYYWQIAEHLGSAARYQFLAEFLKDQEIPELRGRTVPAIRGKLGGNKFYAFVTRPKDLLKIAFVNHRSLNDPDGAPTYQRLVSRSRIREISKFIRNGGFFPTNILLNFTRSVRFDKLTTDEKAGVIFGTLYLPDRYRSAWVIDGQHRLYGFSPLDDSYLDEDIIVVAFEKLNKAEEANLFVTINHEQKSVPKHLLDDLEGELKWGSTIPSERIGAIASRLINSLNGDIGYPFHNRITQQGIPPTNKTCLTIPALKDAIRRSGLLGKAVQNNKNYELGPLCGATDTETLEKSWTALNSYFELIREANLLQWEKGREGLLCTNVAVQGYIMLLGSLIRYWEANMATSAKELDAAEVMVDIEDYLEPIAEFLRGASDEKMNSAFKVQFGAGGPREYYFRLCKMIKERIPDFEPEGMEEWEAEQSAENIESADRKIKDIVLLIQHHLFRMLKKVYGDGDAYWNKGVTDKNMKAEAYKRSLDSEDEDRLALENYLDVIDYKKITESKQNWPFLKDIFDLPEPGEKGIAKNLKWMDRINELRRIAAHPSKERNYKLEDFQYIDYVYERLQENIKQAETAAPERVGGTPA